MTKNELKTVTAVSFSRAAVMGIGEPNFKMLESGQMYRCLRIRTIEPCTQKKGVRNLKKESVPLTSSLR